MPEPLVTDAPPIPAIEAIPGVIIFPGSYDGLAVTMVRVERVATDYPFLNRETAFRCLGEWVDGTNPGYVGSSAKSNIYGIPVFAW